MKQEYQDPIETSFIIPNSRWYSRPTEGKNHKKNKTGPCKRWGHSMAITDNRLFVYGGTGYANNAKLFESIYQLDLESWDWTKLDSINKVPSPRDSHSCIVYSNKLYIFGGSSGNDSKNDMYEYDLSANSWKKLEERGNVPSPREGHSACLLDNRYMVIYGGWNGEETFDNCYLFDIPQKTWILVERMLGIKPTPRESQSCCMVRRDMYFFGGQGNSIVKDGENLDNFYNDLYRLRIRFDDETRLHASATWELIEPKGIKPSKRSSHSSCAYKDRYVFIVGGEGYPPDIDKEKQHVEYRRVKNEESGDEYPCFPKNDVWAYDVEINQWFKLKIRNEADFLPRFAHNNVIHRECLVIFGGLHDYHHSTNDVQVLSLTGENPFVMRSSGKTGKMIGDEGIKDEEENTYQSQSENTSALQSEMDYKEKEFAKTVTPMVGFRQEISVEQKVEQGDRLFEGIPALERPILSTNFLRSLSYVVSWPLAAFGLLLDNARIIGAKNFSINYQIKQRRRNVKDIIDENNTAGDKSLINSPYLVIEDNGVGWGHEDFIKILATYDTDPLNESQTAPNEAMQEEEKVFNSEEDEEKKQQQKQPTKEESKQSKVNEYGFNFKVASVRLGKNIIILSRNGDEISLGFLTADKRFNPNMHRHHTFYYSWKRSTGEYLTNRAEKNRSIIRNALSGMFSLEDLASGIEKIGTRIVILDLSRAIGSSMNHKKKEEPELLFIKRDEPQPVNDIMVRTLDRSLIPFYKNPSSSIIELSLRTYLSYFWLNPLETDMQISLNNSLVTPKNVKETIDKATIENSIVIKEDDGFEGVINYVQQSEEKRNDFFFLMFIFLAETNLSENIIVQELLGNGKT